MKKFLTLLTLITAFSTSAFAHDYLDLYKLEQLKCTDNDGTNAYAVRLFLDDSVYTPGSGYKHPAAASLYFNYSSAQNMTCIGTVKNDSYDVNCVGYYYDKEITEVKFRSVGDKVLAYWKTSKVYGSRDIVSECAISN
jgi:hypothetical protein